jgi:hypothetical protein
MTPVDTLLARVVSLGGPHHLSQPRTTEATTFDAVEGLATLLHSIEGRLSILDHRPDLKSHVETVVGIRGEQPHPGNPSFDLDGSRAWSVLALLVGSLRTTEARLAALSPKSHPLAIADGMTLFDEQPDDDEQPDPATFGPTVDALVSRALAADARVDRLLTKP